MQSNKPNIFMFYETTTGLGHLRRTSGIANALADNGAQVIVASGTMFDTSAFFRENVKIVTLPAHHINKDEKFYYYNEEGNRIENPKYDFDKWVSARETAIKEVAHEYRPHAVLAEFWPFNRRKDLSHLVVSVKNVGMEFGRKPIIFSSVRDILETKSSESLSEIERYEKEKKIVEIIDNQVDRILVHGDSNLVSFENEFMHYNDIKTKLTYTGYVVNDAAKKRGRKKKTVVLSVGSGSTGEDMLVNTLKARPYSMLRDYNWMVVLGPRLGDDKAEKIIRLDETIRAEYNNSFKTEIFKDRNDLPEVFPTVSFSVSLAGYNTTQEVLASGVRALLIPKFKKRSDEDPWFDIEQSSRLEKLQQNGLAVTCNPKDTFDAKGYAEIIDAAFKSVSLKNTLDMNGASKTAKIVLDTIKSRFDI